ncbi:MAG: hypothetical protein IPH86_09225 [bacterium]|nr:hypothetical protein [bacterium]
MPSTAVVIPRVFNDTPFSVLNVANGFPGLIQFDDTSAMPAGWANLHTWRFSQNGVSAMDFMNQDAFAFSADVTISGANGEAGLQITPWWSQADGRFNIRTPDGEVAVFGGRLPFYSFTANHGKVYVAGTTVRLTMIYTPTPRWTRPIRPPSNTSTMTALRSAAARWPSTRAIRQRTRPMACSGS